MNTSAYIFAIFVGATIFALVLRECGGDELIESALVGLGFGPHGLIIFVLVLVFILGFFLDWIEISLIILPLLGPVVAGLDLGINGYGVVEFPNLTWFALLVAVTLQTSFLTPPVGFALFYLKGVCPPEVKMTDIYRGVVPLHHITADWSYVGLHVPATGHLAAGRSFPSRPRWLRVSNKQDQSSV